MSFLAREANSTSANFLAGFQGPLCSEEKEKGKRKKEGERQGRKGMEKNPEIKFWLRRCC